MNINILPANVTRGCTPSRLTAGVIVAFSLLAAACGELAPNITSPTRQLSLASSQAAGATDFTVLANQAVTCTNGTIIGNVGTDQAAPTGSVTTTICPIAGTVNIGNGAAQAAYDDFVARWIALTPTLGECTTANTLTGTLAGVTLSPGTYCVSAEAKTGVLTLVGNGPWTFKVLGALTGTNFTVLMANASKVCNVTWWVKDAATMTDSRFIGTILAGAGITLTRGTYDGNIYSQGDVTVTGTDLAGCTGGSNGGGSTRGKCNQGVGNGPEGCDPGNSNHNQVTNDENGGTPGKPGRKP